MERSILPKMLPKTGKHRTQRSAARLAKGNMTDEVREKVDRLNRSTIPESEAGLAAPTGSADSWRLHILGPDDLIPMESELHALREANMLNIGMARDRLKRPNDPNMPWCMAVVERNGVEYSNDQISA